MSTAQWTVGQLVTITDRHGVALKLRTIKAITRNKLTLNDDTTWDGRYGNRPWDERRTSYYMGPSLRERQEGDAETIERRRYVTAFSSLRGEDWAKLPTSTLRMIRSLTKSLQEE